MNPATIASLLLGAATIGAILLAVSAFRRPLPHLAKTLTTLTATDDTLLTGPRVDGSAPTSLLDRWGTVLISTGRLTPTHKQLAQLKLRNISVARFYGERVAAAGICAVMIAMLWWAAVQIGGPVGYAVPLGAVLAAAAVGWFLPALRIASSAQQVTEDASEALLVYIDLVVLGRMANKHARAALTEAANVCDNPVFLNIRQALARAELEREPPWAELRRLADRLDLPQIADIADIAALQDEGVSLAAAFRARVAELRNAYVVRRQREADRITQRMELPKFLPVMVVSLAIILPPLMKIAS
jgi:tight adherence protein C